MAGETAITLSRGQRELLEKLSEFFGERGIPAYATGGFLRDALLRRPVHDIDISIAADPLTAGPDLAAVLEGHFFPLHDEHQQARVALPSQALHIDLLPLRGTIEEDLRLRDYTIDGLAAPLSEAASGRVHLLDPDRGLDDLNSRTVRLVSEEALAADPLRLLRGVRLATELDFSFEPGTAALIKEQAAMISQAAAERQRDELMRALSAPKAARGLRLMDEVALLDRVLPEMAVTRGAEQPKEHYWDVLDHSFAAVEAMDALLAEEEPAGLWGDLWRELWSQLGWWAEARDYLREELSPGTSRTALLKLCAFLHDIGKPETRSFDETGRMRFFGHSGAGAQIAGRLMRRLRFSSREIGLVRSMIEAHLRPVQMAQQGPPSRRAIYRFFRDSGGAGIDTLLLSLADHLGTAGPRVSLDGFRRHVAVVNYILQKRSEEPRVISPPKLLRGDELMAELGIAPGRLVGELLEAIREAQAAGEIATREEALEFARRRMGIEP